MKHALQTKITGRGQTAIPVAIQEAIGALPGKSLRWSINKENLCTVCVVDEEAEAATSMLGFAKTFRTTRSTESWMKELGGVL